MQKFKVTDNGNANGTSIDRDGVVAGTSVKSYFLNDNFFNLFEFLTSQGYTLIDGDTSQLAKANKSLYNATYIYNTSAIATQSVSDIVEGSDGYYYKVLSDATTGDNPVGSLTGNWLKVPYDKLADINSLTSKTTPIDADVFVGADSADTFALKKFTWANLKATLKTYFDTLYGNFVANDARVKTALNAGGTAPIYACRAWVNFNGTGTVAIRASGNVSSITDNGTGLYRTNFITAMQDANYSVTQGGVYNSDATNNTMSENFNFQTGYFDTSCANGSGAQADHFIVSLTVTR